MSKYEDVSNYFQYNAYDSQIARGLIEREGTPEAIRYFVDNCDKLTDYSYWFMLSTCWVSYSGYYDLENWKRLFASNRPKREKSIMKPSEIRALKSLPYEVTCYRAYRIGETDWISYTTKIDKAIEFALHRGNSVIKEYRIKKKDILAYFTRLGEFEIVSLDSTNAKYIGTISRIIPKEYTGSKKMKG